MFFRKYKKRIKELEQELKFANNMIQKYGWIMDEMTMVIGEWYSILDNWALLAEPEIQNKINKSLIYHGRRFNFNAFKQHCRKEQQ